MDNPPQRKKNIDILEDIQLTLKGLLTETDQLKRDVRYIKTLIELKVNVNKPPEPKPEPKPESTGWFW